MIGRLIKTNLYYFFHNRIVTVIYIISSFIVAIMPWLRNLHGNYKTLSASEYIASLNPNNMEWYDVRTSGILFMIIIFTGIMMSGIFKNKMVKHQEIAAGKICDPLISMVISSWIVTVIYMFPTIIMMTVLSIKNGTLNYNGEGRTYGYLLAILAVIIVNMLHMAANVILLSYIFRSEIVGSCVTAVLEIVKIYVLSIVFLGFTGKVMWIPYGLFAGLNCTDLTLRAIGEYTNVPETFDFMLPFAGLLAEVLVFGAIAYFREKQRQVRQG